MNDKATQLWLKEHHIVLEESFTSSLQVLANMYKKNNICQITDVYAMLGCSKDNISRWMHNPCSTHSVCKKHKLAVILKAGILFGLNEQECEALANKAGLSFIARENALSNVIDRYQGKYCDLLRQAAVSERMFQYYIAGKAPTKQTLIAITIALGLPIEEVQTLLHSYGYCLSNSLPNDAVVLWFLKNRNNKEMGSLLYSINIVLEELGLSVLMTKLYTKRITDY